ncbi:MAG: single-stranded-DNA-specific exonuclease RecJ [Syntrophomonadaceae bacterium]|nr:single-stranded-DNA-specific exonuclease RecJ [Syntrophomonadaceae bacterium]MDD3022482.1 single-stranded-DNA-specific exonuclease RecJ [Syntrophomonadaceae bacterium]
MHFRNSWELRDYDKTWAATIEKELGLSRIAAQLLVQRGVKTIQDAQRFLYGELKHLSDPFDMEGMRAAVRRIEQAINNNEQVVVYGDYDVDGVCSIVLLLECLQHLGAKPAYYVPDRFSEGYGLNSQAIESLFSKGCQLLISVDCGITSTEEVDTASRLGVDVIITDHHTPADRLPAASAIINPKLDKNENIMDLAGVGVVFKLAIALSRNKIAEERIYDWLELVALATVADIVPLRGENRILLKYGLERLKNSKRPGLLALLKETGLEGKTILPWHLGFVLGPRLNSAGRLENARTSIELLLTDDANAADHLAAALCSLNNERRLIEEEIFQEAILQVHNSIDLEKEAVLVLGADNWHHGVIGIVASRLCSKYQRPVILICWEGDTGRGSARSIPGIDIYALLNSCEAFLVQFGGHKMAAGLSIKRDMFNVFKSELIKLFNDRFKKEELIPVKLIDVEVDIEDIHRDLLKELTILEPFGQGNPAPLFILRGMGINQAMLVGKQQEHFKLLTEPGQFEGIAFNKPAFISLPFSNCYHDLIFELGENDYRGRKSIQFKIQEMKCSFLPDSQPRAGFTNDKVLLSLSKAVAELQDSRPVMFVFPTYRSLKLLKIVLQKFFLPASLESLHGLIGMDEKKIAINELKQGASKIFLITQAFLKHYLENNDLPVNLKYIAEVWPGENTDILSKLAGEKCIDKLHNNMERPMVWKQVEWNYDRSKNTIIYANRSKTINKLSKQLPDAITATSIKDTQTRKTLRRRFQEAESSVILTDSSWREIAGAAQNIDELIFADVPFSAWEANYVLEQLAAGSEHTARVLFKPGDIKLYKDYLAKIYPNLEKCKNTLQFFKSLGKNHLKADLKELTFKLSEWSNHDPDSIDLLPILYILADLGLCSFKKKGSIIEIMFHNVDKKPIDISNSSYYLEGLAEKTAFIRLESEINKYLAW